MKGVPTPSKKAESDKKITISRRKLGKMKGKKEQQHFVQCIEWNIQPQYKHSSKKVRNEDCNIKCSRGTSTVNTSKLSHKHELAETLLIKPFKGYQERLWKEKSMPGPTDLNLNSRLFGMAGVSTTSVEWNGGTLVINIKITNVHKFMKVSTFCSRVTVLHNS